MLPRPLAALAAAALATAPACTPRPAKLVGQPVSSARDWLSSQQRDHPLVGKIWDVRAGRFVEESALVSAVTGADFVMLGEMHDNPDHHVLQARLVRALAASGRRPALAFEMLDLEDQPKVDASLAEAPRDADALGRAVEWDRSGWYRFAMYRPIFVEGLAAGLPVIAANLPSVAAKGAVMKGPEALPEATRALLAEEEPLAPEVVASLRKEMRASHCDAPLPEPFLDRLAVAQRARDAHMASRILEAGGTGAVLVTGNGHARRDRGVPMTLARRAPARPVVSVGIFEVSRGRAAPGDYAAEFGAETLPFDLVVFTPGTEREDPCDALEGHDWKVKKMSADHPPVTEEGGAPAPAGGGGAAAKP
jgi:uncharacterized iron-regulated protein